MYGITEAEKGVLCGEGCGNGPILLRLYKEKSDPGLSNMEIVGDLIKAVQ